ncbi:MAG: type II methionyl aminopeptidase [Crenarchaeota archaeon]|nr:type II methionyl aminopeptidase [Thermoproteota archaeon]
MLNREDLETLRKVGDIVHRTLNRALNIVRPGMKVLDLCEDLENYIRSQGARPAFPVNVSINDVAAHYTAKIGDDLTIPEKSVVKIDVGAHIEGLIVDAAVTVSFDPIYDNLLKAALEALKTVKHVLRHGVPVRKIGAAIEKTIRAHGFKPIENLTGHLIRRYELHAGKSIPNIDNGDERHILEGEIYAIEPFATNGAGVVIDYPTYTIYRLQISSAKQLKKVQKKYGNIINDIVQINDHLPFTPRWLKDKYSNIMDIIEKLVEEKILYAYPMLVEEKHGYVSQFEDTFIILSDGCEELAHTLDLFR